MSRRWGLALVALCIGCSGTAIVSSSAATSAPSDAPAISGARLDEERERYLNDGAARRAELVRSLTRPENTYSRQRLDAYGLGDRGWDLLPAWNPRTRAMNAELAARVERGEALDAEGLAPLWDGVMPSTEQGWIELGRRVFFEFPMRAEILVEHALGDPAGAEALGVERAADGHVPGAVVFLDVDREVRVGMSCALCHSAIEGGAVVPGRARRSLDVGRMRMAWLTARDGAVDARDAQRLGRWGPGRADVTEDDDEDPVAIPDLWGLRDERWLTQGATLRQESPIALAIRQETQLIDSNHLLVRPRRELVWALVMYLYSLAPPRSGEAPPPGVEAGRALFDEHCRSCHSNAALGGEPIDASAIGTDPALANGKGRGTGRYRVPPLLAIGRGAPYLHDGSVASLDELLSPERLSADYTRGRFGPGPIPGHPAGTRLDAEARASLLAYLATL
ncbi:MAG: cytochrome c [Polyangiaceae bacterium]